MMPFFISVVYLTIFKFNINSVYGFIINLIWETMNWSEEV